MLTISTSVRAVGVRGLAFRSLLMMDAGDTMEAEMKEQLFCDCIHLGKDWFVAWMHSCIVSSRKWTHSRCIQWSVLPTRWWWGGHQHIASYIRSSSCSMAHKCDSADLQVSPIQRPSLTFSHRISYPPLSRWQLASFTTRINAQLPFGNAVATPAISVLLPRHLHGSVIDRFRAGRPFQPMTGQSLVVMCRNGSLSVMLEWVNTVHARAQTHTESHGSFSSTKHLGCHYCCDVSFMSPLSCLLFWTCWQMHYSGFWQIPIHSWAQTYEPMFQ